MLITLGSLAVWALKDVYYERLLDWRSPLWPLIGTTGFVVVSGYYWKSQQRHVPLPHFQSWNGSHRRMQRRRTLLLKPLTLPEISPDQRKRNIVILGLTGAGKTAFLQRLLRTSSRVSDEPEPTTGVKMTSVDLKGLRQTYYEVGGAETTRMFAKEFLHLANLIIFVVDAAADPVRFDESRQFYKFIADDTDYRGPIVIIASKQDLPNALPVRDVYEALGVCDKDDVYVLPAQCAPRSHAESNEGDQLRLSDDNNLKTTAAVDPAASNHYGMIENLLYRTFTE